MDDWLTIRTRVLGARQARTELNAEAAAVREVGNQTAKTAAKTDVATRSSVTYRQGLYTLRRGLYATTLSLGAFGTAALAMGIKFDSSMEQNRISLTYFLGSTKAANRELATLYKLAATTPFEFGQVTDAARRFLGFGFTVKQANDYLRILADTTSGLGLGGEGIDRLTIVLGQIKASGRLLGQDLLQLTQAGVPALPILQSQLHLSQAQMQQLLAGNLQIPSDVAINALMGGLQKRFGGMSALQAQTGQGLASTARDYFRQLAGTIALPLFDAGKQRLKSLIPVLQELNTAFKRGGIDEFFTTLDQHLGNRGIFTSLLSIGRSLRTIFGPEMRQALRDTAYIVGAVLVPALHATAWILRQLAGHSRAVRVAFEQATGTGILHFVVILSRKLDQLIDRLSRLRKWFHLPFNLSKPSGFGLHNPFAGLAGGGRTVTAGGVLVGERGPELLNLPAAAKVTPLKDGGSGLMQRIFGTIVAADVILDERKVGQAVFRLKQTVEAGA